MEPDYRYCRRETPAGTPCGKPIERRNALAWCQACRTARLPMWPTEPQPQPQEAALAGKQ